MGRYSIRNIIPGRISVNSKSIRTALMHGGVKFSTPVTLKQRHGVSATFHPFPNHWTGRCCSATHWPADRLAADREYTSSARRYAPVPISSESFLKPSPDHYSGRANVTESCLGLRTRMDPTRTRRETTTPSVCPLDARTRDREQRSAVGAR
jgi:hypothetical protein